MTLFGFVRNVVFTVGLLTLLALAAQAPGTVVGKLAAASAAKAGRSLSRHADFNGDGFDDLAIGVYGEGVGSAIYAGAVQVIYGSAAGLTAANDQFWTQNSPGLEDIAEDFDNFGGALAAGDFNADGFTDLAVGVPGEDVGSIGNAGAVQVLYGSAAGLTSANDQLWTQDSPSMKDAAEDFDEFGWALAAGDFNADGFADLAVGVRQENVGSILYAGAVQLLYGSAAGLTAAIDQFWTQDSPGIEDIAEVFDLFGSALAAGDFNADGFADLAVGVPSEDVGFILDAGAVQVLYGSAAGLTAVDNQLWTQDSEGIEDTAEPGDLFGLVLAAEDFSGDGFADLAVGVPFEALESNRPIVWEAGGVQVLYGSSVGLTAAEDQFWTQGSTDVEDSPEHPDRFGAALTAGDFNGDGFADLAIGAAYEAIGRTLLAGAANVLYGSGKGLSAANNQFWNQDSNGIRDRAENGDRFGTALAAGDFNADGWTDLAIGVPSEDVRGIEGAGAVNSLYGSSAGLAAANNQFWTQDRAGMRDMAELGDFFGFSLASR